MLAKLATPEFFCGLLFFFIIANILLIYLYVKRGFLAKLLLFFYIICSVFILADFFSPFLIRHNDSWGYFIPTALSISNSWRSSLWDSISKLTVFDYLLLGGKQVYLFPLAGTFYLFYDSLIAARLLSTIFSILVIIMLYSITKDLYDTKTAKFSALLIALSPYFWNLSTAVLRDTMAFFFLLWFFRSWQVYEKRPTSTNLFLILLCIYVSGLLRPPIMLVIIMVFISYKSVIKNNRQRPFYQIAIFILIYMIISVGLVTYVANSNIAQDLRLAKGVEYTDIDTLIKKQQVASDADSGYTEEYRFTSIWEAMIYMPMLSFYFMCAPLPWMVKKPNQVLALMDSSILWILYFLFFMEVRSFYKRNVKWAVIIYSYLFFGISSASIVQGNMGGSVRHRILFTLLIIPFAARQILLITGRVKNTTGESNLPSTLGKFNRKNIVIPNTLNKSINSHKWG